MLSQRPADAANVVSSFRPWFSVLELSKVTSCRTPLPTPPSLSHFQLRLWGIWNSSET